MSLASPLSIGDAILLGKIAYEVGKAFSSGAKSASAEFAEVQSLLFSMGDALDLVGKTFSGWTEQEVQEETAAKIDGILKNCQTVLKSLDHFVDKYSVLESSQASILGAKSARVWKTEIFKNFKKVAWTAEGEGITKLKQTLTAHVQALNLAVAAMSGKKQAITHEDVSDTREHVRAMRIKFDEIHAWYEENLKLPPQSHGSPRPNSRSSYDADSFALYEERGNGGESQTIVCPHARIEDLWAGDSESQTDMSERNIFKCGCSSGAGSDDLPYTHNLFVQVIGKHSGMRWQVYVRSLASNTPVSLILQDIESRDISKILAWVGQAALHLVANHLGNGLQTYFVQADQETISALRMKTNSFKYTAKLLNVVFRTTNGAFTVGRLNSIQVLQYGTTWHPDHLVEPPPAQLFPQAYVNIILNCLPDHSQAQKCFTVRVNQDTNFSVAERPRYVAVDDVICYQEIINAGSQGSSPSNLVERSKITLEFSDSEDAQEFLAGLKDAKQKLRMQYLQQVRWGDKLIGQLDIAGELLIRNLILQDVKLSVLLDQATNKFRMALVRRDHSASVTFELPPNFVNDLADGKESGYNNHPAWFMDIGKDRITIIKQESGIDPLAALYKAFQDSNMGNNQIEIEDMLPDSD